MTDLVGTSWHHVLDAVSDPVLVADESGALLYANSAARVLLGERASGAVTDLMAASHTTWTSRGVEQGDRRFVVHTGTAPLAEATQLLDDLETEPTVERLASLCQRWLADVVLIELRNHDGLVYSAAVGERAHLLREVPADRIRPRMGGEAMLTGRPSFVADVRDEHLRGWSHDDAHEAALRALAPRSVLSLPLMAPAGVLGVLVLVRTSPNPFSEADRRLAEELAARGSRAVSSAQRFEAARRTVEQVERKVQVVVHDLRGPISAVAMAAQHLVRVLPAELEQHREMLKGIQSSALRAARLVGDLVRPETAARHAPHAVDDLLTQTRSLLEVLVSEAALSLVVRLDADLPPVLVDRQVCLELLGTLVGEAVANAPAGTRIELSARRDGEKVVLRVAGGTPPRPVPRAEQLAEAQGSELCTESLPSGGAAVCFRVPVASEPDPA